MTRSIEKSRSAWENGGRQKSRRPLKAMQSATFRLATDCRMQYEMCISAFFDRLLALVAPRRDEQFIWRWIAHLR